MKEPFYQQYLPFYPAAILKFSHALHKKMES